MAMATAAASETVSLSRGSRWRKVSVELAAASVSVCKRLLFMFAKGWSLTPRDQSGSLWRQVRGACSHMNPVNLTLKGAWGSRLWPTSQNHRLQVLSILFNIPPPFAD